MSGIANCYDNAVMESFLAPSSLTVPWGSLLLMLSPVPPFSSTLKPGIVTNACIFFLAIPDLRNSKLLLPQSLSVHYWGSSRRFVAILVAKYVPDGLSGEYQGIDVQESLITSWVGTLYKLPS
jgi:hypothetical protein